MNSAVDVAIGALGAGLIGLLFFFVKRYFTNREEDHKETKGHVDAARLNIAGIEARLDEQSKILLAMASDLKFMQRQIERVFSYIDAPKRETDKVKEVKQ